MKKVFVILTVVHLLLAFPFSSIADDSNKNYPGEQKGSSESLSDQEKELRVGHLLDGWMVQNFVMFRDERLIKKIIDIVKKINQSPPRNTSTVEFKVRIINDVLPLASSFPGYLYVSTGLLDILETEGELAAVIFYALAKVSEKCQLNALNDEYKSRRTAQVVKIIAPFLAIVGGVFMAAAMPNSAMASPAAYQSYTLKTSVAIGFATTQLSNTADAVLKRVPKRKTLFNRLGPTLYGYYINNSAILATSYAVFKEVYEGYESEIELKATDIAIKNLERSGYNREAMASLNGKLLAFRMEYISKGYVSNLFIDQANLEKRLDYAIKNTSK